MSPLACIRCARATLDLSSALGRRLTEHDLLDANEWTWAFEFLDRVGWGVNVHVKALEMLSKRDGYRSYCGRAADGLDRRESGRWPCEAHIRSARAPPLWVVTLSFPHCVADGTCGHAGSH
jgi:hypothetical protein